MKRDDYVVLKLFEQYSQRLYFIRRDLISSLKMSVNEYQAITVLANIKNVNQKTLCNLCSLEKSTASRLVDKLCVSGYVTRVKNDSDKRNVDLVLSADGRKAAKKIKVAVKDAVAKYFLPLGEKDSRDLTALLNKCII